MGEARKIVTIVFSDVTGSTSLGEQLDAETLRRVMERYFTEARSVLERHGGTVEKFIGDAVMAAFGIPAAHEDDALRAVRAAVEMRAHLAELNEELAREHGVTLAVRTGINTGEVVAGDPGEGQFYASGDAVNVAARLEQAAPPGEILLGEPTYRLVRNAVAVEAVEPLIFKGKSQVVPAHRLLEVIEGAPALARRFDTPFVGREEELRQLIASFERSIAAPIPVLVTVLGPAGIGKTRLATELIAQVGVRATTLQARCLAYGEGITFWPLQEILRNLAERPAEAPDPERAGSVEETFWAYRKLFEALAHERPLLLVLEDVHWAEPTLLDLIEHIVAWTRDAPLAIVCVARPELLDDRPDWPGERLELEPLPERDSETLVATLAPGLEPHSRARAVRVAEGNPLFLEQLLALAAEDGHELAVPDTIQALLAARLDRLEADERALLERAAVIGKEFWRGALLHLSPPDTEVSSLLQRLMRKRLIQPERSSFAGEDAFRFGHSLIRDAAYAGIAKETRAEAHERFADFLGEGESPYGEIAGYHLEQAYRYRLELGPLNEALHALGDRASNLLEQAGLGAVGRRDPAAVNLLERARELQSNPARRLTLSVRLAEALDNTGQPERSWSLLGDVIDEARRRGDTRTEWHAIVNYAHMGTRLDPAEWDDRVEEIAERALRVFDELNDLHGLGRACALAGWNLWNRCRYDDAAQWHGQWLTYAQQAGDQWEEVQALDSRLHAMFYGSTHVDAVLSEAEAILARVEGSARAFEIFLTMAALRAMRGEAAASRALYLSGKSLGQELGIPTAVTAGAKYAEEVGLLLGDAEFAEREQRAGVEYLEAVGERGFRSTLAAQLADSLYELGRHAEAQHFADLSLELTSTLDIASQAKGRAVMGKLLAIQGDYEAGERLAREATKLASNTDSLFMQGQVLMSLAEVLRLAGRDADAIPVLREATVISERKGNVVTAQRARARLAALHAATRA